MTLRLARQLVWCHKANGLFDQHDKLKSTVFCFFFSGRVHCPEFKIISADLAATAVLIITVHTEETCMHRLCRSTRMSKLAPRKYSEPERGVAVGGGHDYLLNSCVGSEVLVYQ